MDKTMLLFLALIATTACNVRVKEDKTEKSESEKNTSTVLVSEKPQSTLHDSTMINLQEYSDLFVYDMRYATDNNFLNEKVYDCTNCMIRLKVAKALVEAAEMFQKQGHKIKFFDCTRPVEVQKKMWKIMPDGRYVANPYKSGSIHNRGAAVDITLVDSNNTELDMGTDFDHFSEIAHHAYQNLSEEVLANRRYLKETMESAGFNAIKTEWWHYNYGGTKYNITKVPLCE